MRRALRILSTALITSGLVILADVALTLAWKEPISSIYGSIEQSQARDQLVQLEKRFPSARDLQRIAPLRDRRRKIAALAEAFAQKARIGEAIGEIRIPRLGLDAVLIEGTDTASLQKGPGHYGYTPFPGRGGTVGIAGHRTTYLAPFRNIDSLVAGDRIQLEVPYATFEYEVQKHEIVDPSATQIVRPVGYERLVLTACTPLYSAAQRYAVFAKLVDERVASR